MNSRALSHDFLQVKIDFQLKFSDTLPPALTSTPFDEKNYFTLSSNTTETKGIYSSPIPPNERGKELTFQETGKHKTFMFAESNTFIQLDGEIIQTFQLR